MRLAAILGLVALPLAAVSPRANARVAPDAEVADESGSKTPRDDDRGEKSEAEAETKDEAETEEKAETKARKRRRRLGQPGGPPDGRKWMIGIEGVVMQAPPLRTEIIYLDPRFVGRSVAMGGLGVFGRFRPNPFVGFDLGVRSGSIRYQNRDTDDQVSQDQVMADGGVLLYLGRGDVAQFALSGGMGGMYNRIGYDLGDRGDAVQTFGSGLVRLGAEAEFVVKRVAFILSFRSYGVFTLRDQTGTRGELFDSAANEVKRAPVATFQTLLVGSAGIAYRF